MMDFSTICKPWEKEKEKNTIEKKKHQSAHYFLWEKQRDKEVSHCETCSEKLLLSGKCNIIIKGRQHSSKQAKFMSLKAEKANIHLPKEQVLSH